MNQGLKKSAQKIQDILHEYNINTNVIEFPQLTRTAQEAANVIGCQVAQIAKTLIFKGILTGKPICVIASGVNRVDIKIIEQYVGEPLEKASADYVLEQTGFTIGGISPVGFSFEQKPFIDQDLLQYQELWAAAGTPNSVFCLSPDDLLRLTQGRTIDLKMH